MANLYFGRQWDEEGWWVGDKTDGGIFLGGKELFPPSNAEVARAEKELSLNRKFWEEQIKEEVATIPPPVPPKLFVR